MKLTNAEAMTAVQRMGILKFFPTDDLAREEISAMLIEMIQTDKWGTAQTKLEWLIRAMRDNVGEWPGPKELRGVYCCKFPPSDGIETYSTLDGFTPQDSEGGTKASCLSAKPEPVVYLPAPGDEPIGELALDIAKLAEAKRGN